MEVNLETPSARRHPMLSTHIPPEQPRNGMNQQQLISVQVIAGRGIERSALRAVVAAEGFTYVPSFASGPVDVLIVREGAGVRTVEVLNDLPTRGRSRVLSVCDSLDGVAVALASGADGAMTMDSTPARLASAICEIFAGNAVIPREALSSIMAGDANRPHLDALEAAVLTELLDGASDAMIGRRCNLTSSAVRGVVGGLFRKLGARDRVEVVIEAHQLGLLVPFPGSLNHRAPSNGSSLGHGAGARGQRRSAR